MTPKAKGSVRLGRMGTYNPSAKGMLEMRKYVQSQLVGKKLPLLKGPLLIAVQYRIPAPLSQPERRRKLLNYLPHTRRPDGDNLDKFLGDALNGVLWDDDSRIAFLFRSKVWTTDKTGETILYVKQMSDEIVNFCDILNELDNNIFD
jgi:Holliday junction resolvase RusA-like endonuclease